MEESARCKRLIGVREVCSWQTLVKKCKWTWSNTKDEMYYGKTGKLRHNTCTPCHIARIMNLVRNGEKCNMHKIDWCEGGLQLADISTKNAGDPDLPQRMKYIMVIIDNWERTLVQ